MAQGKDDGLWQELRRLWALFCVLALLLLSSAYFLAALVGTAAPQDEFAQVAREFVMALSANTIPIFGVAVGSYLLFERLLQYRDVRQQNMLAERVASQVRAVLPVTETSSLVGRPAVHEFPTVQWDELLSTCLNLDICVHYFDTWIEQHRAALAGVFARGGTIRIVLPNPGSTDIRRQIRRRIPETTEDVIGSKIANTELRLDTLCKQSHHKAANLRVYYVDFPTYYCGVRVDRQYLVLSVYEHVREARVSSPATVIPLSTHPQVDTWFEREFEGLMKADNPSVQHRTS